MVRNFGQHVHFAFQDLALVLVAVTQVVPLETLVVSVELVRDTASQTDGLELETEDIGRYVGGGGQRVCKHSQVANSQCDDVSTLCFQLWGRMSLQSAAAATNRLLHNPAIWCSRLSDIDSADRYKSAESMSDSLSREALVGTQVCTQSRVCCSCCWNTEGHSNMHVTESHQCCLSTAL